VYVAPCVSAVQMSTGTWAAEAPSSLYERGYVHGTSCKDILGGLFGVLTRTWRAKPILDSWPAVGPIMDCCAVRSVRLKLLNLTIYAAVIGWFKLELASASTAVGVHSTASGCSGRTFDACTQSPY
jgi:hypothetical protein